MKHTALFVFVKKSRDNKLEIDEELLMDEGIEGSSLKKHIARKNRL